MSLETVKENFHNASLDYLLFKKLEIVQHTKIDKLVKKIGKKITRRFKSEVSRC
jgi:hypothetical protein